MSTYESMKQLLLPFRGDLQRSGVFQTKKLEKVRGVKWKFETAGRIFASPVVLGNSVLVGSEDHHLYSFNKDTGHINWRFEAGGAIRSAVCIENNLVYFTCLDGYFYAVNFDNGVLKWRFKTNGEKMFDPWDYYLSTPICSNDVVYFGSGDSHIYALDSQSGEEVWRFQTKGPVHASPTISNQTLYIGGFDGYFYAIDLFTGKEKWIFRTVGDTWFPRGDIQGTASVSDGIVYFGSRDYNLYALDAETGRGKWNFKAPGTWIITTPTVCDGILYFATSDDSQLYAVDAKTGQQKWTLELNINTFGSPIIADDYAINKNSGHIQWVYQTDNSKTFENIILEQDGKLGKHLSHKLKNATKIDDFIDVYDQIMTLGSILSTPFIENGTIYFGSTDGNIYALE
jgi:eukaryotic-like serine/threonine-protein kinase